MELTRRRFLYLCGLAAPGVYVAGGAGLLTPSPALAAEATGTCSFCGKRGAVLVGVGVEGELGAGARICATCLREAQAIVGDLEPVAAEVQRGGALSPPSMAGSPNVVEQELEQILTQAARDYGLTSPEIERLMQVARGKIDGASNIPASQVAHHFATPTCSFCQVPASASRRLVAGPLVFICESCVTSAASLLPMAQV